MKKLLRKNRGWTVVEVMIATLILAFIMMSIFTVFTRMTRSTDVGAWKSSVQQKMRVSMKFLFQELSQATYPSMIYPTKTVVEKTGAYKLKYREGDIMPWETDGEILSFFMCKPGKGKFPKSYPRNVIKAVMNIEKWEDGRPKIMYVRTIEEDNGLDDDTSKTIIDTMKVYSKPIFSDITMIKFIPEVFEDEAVSDPANRKKIRLGVEVRASHPKYPGNTLTLRENIILNVDVEGLEEVEGKDE